ncbi:tRNA 5-methylaminomethyl-2-thiouridine biosynthesis bifunctional protein MnmC [Thermus thermophilus]|uniref:tRNA 5-methylaminomethyl-2-thiouridine biosynthesis bifunctional protein MnmC n=1 Tax=Thermus thermophilus TaxID=274 RepID=A0A3P4AQU5_THETH|nr:tRNA (5-methylaminomethyl-2-thiouridine)(34)-methyltransferase MnmD [Thermus thermophilus]VCU53120.1 tRNA 5-methylaminomethyl-2-thiouridine biosynthesis bifunctional protein MnmC [Thermus thermophilus]
MELRLTQDGTLTLFHPGYGEAYHPRQGALLQARRLYLEKTLTHLHPAPRVLEVGFGLGVNFRVALESALQRGVRLFYLAVEKEPLPREVLAQISLPLPRAEAVFADLLRAWPIPSFQGPWGELRVLFLDVREAVLPSRWATAVYLDPFSPKANPEAWGLPVLLKLRKSFKRGGRLATYSAQGAFRRALREAGFAVHRVPGVGKREWTVGIAVGAPPG